MSHNFLASALKRESLEANINLDLDFEVQLQSHDRLVVYRKLFSNDHLVQDPML